MAMFGTKKEKEAPVPVVKAAPAPVVEEPVAPAVPEVKRPRTLIGPGIKFTGNIEASEDIEINGRAEGNISSGNTTRAISQRRTTFWTAYPKEMRKSRSSARSAKPAALPANCSLPPSLRRTVPNSKARCI